MPEFWDEKRQSQIFDLFCKIQICGCGTNKEWEVVLIFLKRAKEENLNLLDKIDNIPESWIEFGAKALDTWGLIDHNYSIGSSSLTDEGRLLIKFLEEFSINPDNWPEWAESQIVPS